MSLKSKETDIILSIIIPCFNEEDSLPILYQEITGIVKEAVHDYELLFIDDGSKDKTLEWLLRQSMEDLHIRYISFSHNFGKEAAIYAGLRNARGKYVAVMDADMQDPPSLLPQMLSILEQEDYDSVATRRSTRNGESYVRSRFARIFYKIMNHMSDVKIMDGARDFRMMKRKMVDAIISMEECNRFSKGIFGWVGFRTLWISYENIERTHGKSKWNFWELTKYAIDGIISFSQVPLYIVAVFGLLMFLMSFLAGIVIIIRKLICGDPVAGWASTVCIIIFIGSLLMLCVGIIGIYIGKIYVEVKGRPHYIVAETNMEFYR